MLNNKYTLIRFGFIMFIIIFFEIIINFNIISSTIIPKPSLIFLSFLQNFHVLFVEAMFTLKISLLGLFISFFFAIFVAILMDKFCNLEKILLPIFIITQSVPIVAITPLIILIFGYDILSKLVVVIIMCFFPIVINFLKGLKSVDNNLINLMNSMGSNYIKNLIYIKIPSSLDDIFSGFKIAGTYCVSGAVIAEWLGGNDGIGVYMIRVKKSYAYEKMFASVLFIIILSLVITKLIDLVHKFFKKRRGFWIEI